MTVGGMTSSSAGARRGNVLFDAEGPSRKLRLAATILPTAEIEINPITAEAAVRSLAEEHGVPVPHIHAVCTDESFAGGPFFVSDRVTSGSGL